jgi:hypothetical protein
MAKLPIGTYYLTFERKKGKDIRPGQKCTVYVDPENVSALWDHWENLCASARYPRGNYTIVIRTADRRHTEIRRIDG